MKKNSLLKALLIVFGLYVILTWIVPTGYYDNGEFIKQATSPVGIFDLIIYPFITLTSSVFILTALVVLLIGGLYGVLNKTGAYGNLIDKTLKKFKGKEKRILIITIVLFTILSSLTGLTLPLVVLVPFFATVLLLLGYNKFTAMLSTIGAILVGNLASIYGFNVAGYISYLTNNVNDGIWIRLLGLILSLAVLIFITIKTAKLDKKKVNEEEITLYEKNINKKAKMTPLYVTSIIGIIVLLVGMFNWNGVFGIELFNDIHEAVSSFKIGGYDLFGKLIGSVPALGSWTNYELALIIVIAVLIIGKSYKMSFEEIGSAMISGMKEMLPVAVWAIICNILFLLMNIDSNGYTIYNTISNAILSLTKGFNIFTMSIATLIGGLFYNDFPYFLSSLYSPITSMSENYVDIGIITQLIHGLVQLIAPTSVILVIGLTYFKLPYKDWLKNIWKLLIGILIVIVILLILTAIFV